MIRIFTIATNTFTEVIRQPIYLIILLCSLGLIILSPYFTLFVSLHNDKMIKDMGLSTILLCSLFLAVFSASNVIYREVENKTILTIISKPVNRYSFIIGKYTGVLLGIWVAQYLLTLALLHIARTKITEAAYSDTDYPVLLGYLFAIIISLVMAAFVNFFYEKSFTSSFVYLAIPVFTTIFLILCVVGNDWTIQPFGHKIDSAIYLATFLLFLATAILSGIATAASTRLAPMATLFICGAFFLIGLFSDYVFGRHVDTSSIASFFYKAIPNMQIFWVGDAVVEKREIPFRYIGNVFLYTISFLTGILFLAFALFERKETK